MMKKDLDIAVIGAGVVGLSSALCIQRAYPNARLTIYADRFEEDTVSYVAAGLMRPPEFIHPDVAMMKKWWNRSQEHFLSLIHSAEAKAAGVRLVSGYHLSTSSTQLENTLWKELFFEYRHLTEEEIKQFPRKIKNGLFCTTIVTDDRYYLRWMLTKFEKSGGVVIKKHVSDVQKIPENHTVIVNCTGLGAKELLNDRLLVPIRGQVIRVKAPWIKNYYYGNDIYVLPGVDYVTLGGIKDFESSSLEVFEHQRKFIWDRATELLPSLKDAEIVQELVGLRPFRPTVCINACFIPKSDGGSYRLLLNNYGHGGSGVTLSWGTAMEVTELLRNVIQGRIIAAKL